MSKPNRIATAKGGTTIYGHLIKLDDNNLEAVLRLRDDTILTVTLTRGIVSELQKNKRLHQDIGLLGNATWRIDDWSLESFEATSLSQYRPDQQSLTETFLGLRAASKGRWDDIDPDEFVKRLRYGEG